VPQAVLARPTRKRSLYHLLAGIVADLVLVLFHQQRKRAHEVDRRVALEERRQAYAEVEPLGRSEQRSLETPAQKAPLPLAHLAVGVVGLDIGLRDLDRVEKVDASLVDSECCYL